MKKVEKFLEGLYESYLHRGEQREQLRERSKLENETVRTTSERILCVILQKRISMKDHN